MGRQGNSQWSCKSEEDTEGAETTRERTSTLKCRREASKSFNDKETDAINMRFELHVMLDDDTKLSDMAIARSETEFVNAAHGCVTYG